MINQGKTKEKTKQPSDKTKKKTEGHFIVQSHEILDGAVKVSRASKSGQFWSIAYRIKSESKYFRQSLRTKNLEEAKELARNKYFQLMGDKR